MLCWQIRNRIFSARAGGAAALGIHIHTRTHMIGYDKFMPRLVFGSVSN